VSTQNDKKKKGFLQRHLPSSADNDKEPKNISPLSSPQVNQRDGEYKYRGPIFGDFVTILTEGSMQDSTVARLQSIGVQTHVSNLY
jgi:hypothetical protein